MVYAPRGRSILRPGPPVNDNGLVGWWPFDDGQANDVSGGGNNLGNDLFFGGPATFTEGIVPGECRAGALKFNGSTTWMNASKSTALGSGDYSVSAWLNTSSVAAGDAYIIDRTSGAVLNVYRTGSDIIFRVRGDNNLGITTLTASSVLVVGRWYHVVCVRTGGTLYIYINGFMQTSMADGTSGAMTVTLKIGSHLSNSSVWNGSIDDLRVYNRPLAAAEVNALYNSAFMPWMESDMPALSAGAAFQPAWAARSTVTLSAGGRAA